MHSNVLGGDKEGNSAGMRHDSVLSGVSFETGLISYVFGICDLGTIFSDSAPTFKCKLGGLGLNHFDMENSFPWVVDVCKDLPLRDVLREQMLISMGRCTSILAGAHCAT